MNLFELKEALEILAPYAGYGHDVQFSHNRISVFGLFSTTHLPRLYELGWEWVDGVWYKEIV